MSKSSKSGTSHPTEVGGIPVYVVQKPAEPATLRLIKGPEAPKTYTLEVPEIVIGRGEEATIVVESASVSRRHAQLKRVGIGFSCEDLGSANGVFVNGTRRETVELQNGDTLQIGDALFVFQAGT
jgi:pSer/pThr/pTyr-binding forkhead associated (FHA) protein